MVTSQNVGRQSTIKAILRYWRLFIAILTPLIFALMFLGSTSEAMRCAYVILIMAVYWMTEALPLPVTALIPIVLFPLLGILSSSKVCLAYMKETNMMFLGGLIMAIAIEHSNLHKRIALFIMLNVGQSPRFLMAGFMFTTMFLSMWISNTASTAMMVPILDAILQELYVAYEMEDKSPKNGIVDSKNVVGHENVTFSNEINLELRDRHEIEQRNGDLLEDNKELPVVKSLTAPPPNEKCKALKDMFFLSTAYAANLGGTGALTGTAPNLVLKETLDSAFPHQKDLNFASWLAFNVPGMIICTILAWIWLQILFIGFGSKSKIPQTTNETKQNIKKLLQRQYDALGQFTFHETTVLIVFIILVLSWFFREPGFIYGWADLFKWAYGRSFKTGDSVPAILAVITLFFMPCERNFYPSSRFRNGPSPCCLNWRIVHEKLPWGIILLLGGGFAMADGSKASGLSKTLGEKLESLRYLSPGVSVFIVTLGTTMITEVASNTATASIVMPILKDVALSICINPLYFMIPAAVCCSYAFMLPVATPPNAIAFEASGMATKSMMKAGLMMNLLCIGVINIMINTLGQPVIGVFTMPEWANSTNSCRI